MNFYQKIMCDAFPCNSASNRSSEVIKEQINRHKTIETYTYVWFFFMRFLHSSRCCCFLSVDHKQSIRFSEFFGVPLTSFSLLWLFLFCSHPLFSVAYSNVDSLSCNIRVILHFRYLFGCFKPCSLRFFPLSWLYFLYFMKTYTKYFYIFIRFKVYPG